MTPRTQRTPPGGGRGSQVILGRDDAGNRSTKLVSGIARDMSSRVATAGRVVAHWLTEPGTIAEIEAVVLLLDRCERDCELVAAGVER